MSLPFHPHTATSWVCEVGEFRATLARLNGTRAFGIPLAQLLPHSRETECWEIVLKSVGVFGAWLETTEYEYWVGHPTRADAEGYAATVFLAWREWVRGQAALVEGVTDG